jgi:hypothetical protein
VKFLIVLVLILPHSFTSIGQSSLNDSLIVANQKLDSLILDYLKDFESEGHEFMILRVRDSVFAGLNECSFMVSKDSCTSKFKLTINWDFTISYVHVSDFSYYDPNLPCSEKLLKIANEMREYNDFFKSSDPVNLNLENAPFVFYSKVFGNYSLEYFDHEFVSEFHSGLLYDVICHQLYSSCKR